MVEIIGFFLFIVFVALVYGYLYGWMWKDREVSGVDGDPVPFQRMKLAKIRLPIPLLKIPLGMRWPLAE